MPEMAKCFFKYNGIVVAEEFLGIPQDWRAQEAVSYRIGTGIMIYCVYARLKKLTNRDLQRSVIVYFVGRVVGNVVPFKLDR